MRKINKIMMATVSILLTLVLISSCVLSGIFAKYVTSKTASSHMQFERFGVTVDMIVDDAKLERIFGDEYISATALANLGDAEREAAKKSKVWVETSTSDQIKSGINTVTIHNLALKPGDDFTGKKTGDKINDLVQFTIGGTANVRCKVNLDIDVLHEYNDFVVPQQVSGSAERYYMPLGFSAKYYTANKNVVSSVWSGYNDFLYKPYQPYDNSNYHEKVEYLIFSAFAYDFWEDVTLTGYTGDYLPPNIDMSMEKIFKAGDPIGFNHLDGYSINGFNFGVKWNYSSDSTYDAIDTYFSEQQPKITLSYTVTVEQVDSEYSTPEIIW